LRAREGQQTERSFEMKKSECYWTADCLAKDRPKVDAEQTLVVHDRSEDGLVVEISDIITQPESWGVYFADIGFVISGAIAEYNNITQTEAMALIQKGFNSGNTCLPERVPVVTDQIEDEANEWLAKTPRRL
jgi:hypothetical protein